jgi:hypothetical protein
MTDNIRLRTIEFDGDANPSQVTLTFSIESLARITKMLGNISPVSTNPPESYPAASEFYNVVAGDVFNPYWDGGVDDVVL